MASREQNDIAEAVINSLRFAMEHRSLAGRIALSSFHRLEGLLLSQDSWLDCEIRGVDFAGQSGTEPALHLRVSGELKLRCQRCLGEVDLPLCVDKLLVILPPGEDWPEDELESDLFDAIPAEEALAVAALVEDEVLLALPIVPRHRDRDCKLPVEFDGDVAVKEVKASPFAVLSKLKTH